MRSALVVAVLAIAVIGMSVAANASFVGVALNVQATGGSGSFHDVQMGWLYDDNNGAPSTNLKDGVDRADDLGALADQIQLDIINPVIASAKVVADFRSPLEQCLIWRLTAKQPTPTAQPPGAVPITVNAWFNPGMATTSAFIYILNGNKSTQVLCEAALSTASQLVAIPIGGGMNGTEVFSFESLIPAPVYGEEEATWSTPVRTFTVYARNVPEPGSAVALLAGLAGLVGFHIRRRK